MHDSYLITESSRQWRPCDARRVRHSCHHRHMKKTRALFFSRHSKWQFLLPESFRQRQHLSRTAWWTWDNMITLLNSHTVTPDPKLWTYETFLTHKSNMKAFTVALRHSSLCVPFVPAAARQMGLLQQAPASYLCFTVCRDPIKCNPLVARIVFAKPG